MSTPDPYRASDAASDAPTRSTPDPVEVAVVRAIDQLRVDFSTWVARYFPTGDDLAAASRGHGEAVAKITDALVRLRQQKLGS